MIFREIYGKGDFFVFLRNCCLSILMFACTVFVHVGVARGDDCGAGYYVDGDGVCAVCDAGFYCVGDGIKTQCPDNFVSDTGATDCTACPDETPYSYNNQCVACDGSGQYVNDGICDVCEDGKYPYENHYSCTLCNGVGEYINNGVCKICQVGTIPDINRTRCVECDGAVEYVTDDNLCDTCGAGYYVNNHICEPCPAGSYCTGDGTAKQCTGNTYSGTGATECVECASGVVVNNEHTACDDCQTGFCRNGDSCKKCKAGYYCPSGPINCDLNGKPVPTDDNDYKCAVGTYAVAGSTECTACPAGYSTGIVSDNPETGATSIANCKEIPVKLFFDDDDEGVSLPECLTSGKTNNKVIKNN